MLHVILFLCPLHARALPLAPHIASHNNYWRACSQANTIVIQQYWIDFLVQNLLCLWLISALDPNPKSKQITSQMSGIFLNLRLISWKRGGRCSKNYFQLLNIKVVMIWHAHQTHIICPSGKQLQTKITPLFSICLIYNVPSRSGTGVQ